MVLDRWANRGELLFSYALVNSDPTFSRLSSSANAEENWVLRPLLGRECFTPTKNVAQVAAHESPQTSSEDENGQGVISSGTLFRIVTTTKVMRS
jgi:hypothetical protein